MLVGRDRIGICALFPAIHEHVHAAPAVVIGVEGPLDFIAGDDRRVHRSRAVLIAPGFAHAVDAAGGRVAMFVLRPQAMASAVPLRDLDHPGHWLEVAGAMIRQQLTDFDAVDRALARERCSPHPVHEGLQSALAALAGAVDQNLSVAALAARARLSPSRLMCLAREQLGTSLRAYRRWVRTFQVARDYAAGRSLTEAALDAGFASSAHLSAAARAHFGIRPSDILAPANRGGITTI